MNPAMHVAQLRRRLAANGNGNNNNNNNNNVRGCDIQGLSAMRALHGWYSVQAEYSKLLRLLAS